MKKTWIRGLISLIAADIALLAAACMLSLSEWIHPVLSGVCLWGVFPLLGAGAACWMTLHSVNNYLAWLPALLMLTLGYWLVWGYLPAPGQMVLSGLVGIVGAATGETKKRFDGRKGK